MQISPPHQNKNKHDPLECLLFYTTFGLLNKEDQIGVLARVMLDIHDESQQSHFISCLFNHYRKEPAEELLNFVVRVGTYGAPEGRIEYQRKMIAEGPYLHNTELNDESNVNDENIVNVFKWPMKANERGSLDFWVTTMASYVETIRNFMIDGKDDHVAQMLKEYIDGYVNKNIYMQEVNKMVNINIDDNF